MERTKSPFNPFKSKKILRSSSKSALSNEIPATDKNPLPANLQEKSSQIQSPDQNPWSSKTPEKPTRIPQRIRNRGVALSLKEVKKAAQGLRKSEEAQSIARSEANLSSARKKILSWPDENPINESSKDKGLIKLPEKYELLGEFFNSLESSIRLLRLKGSMSTYTNICPKIECLTDRKFSYAHLAQLKFILPEAIMIKKVLLHDERTLCMKPDLQITLQVNGIEKGGKQKKICGSSSLRKVFQERLSDFFKAHPMVDEIPEETLPEPFNRAKQDMISRTIEASNPLIPPETSTNALLEQHQAAASHTSVTFQRHFSRKVSNYQAENAHSEPSHSSANPMLSVQMQCDSDLSSREEIVTSVAPYPLECYSKPPNIPLNTITNVEKVKNEDCSSVDVSSIQGTPVKHISTPAKLMTSTPALQPPGRCVMSPDDDYSMSPRKLVRRPTRTRSLKFDTPVKNSDTKDEINEAESSSIDLDIYDILPETLLQSIREKERNAKEEQDPAISQAKWRRQMIACLPKLFDMIRLLFQSSQHSVMTKEELTEKIIGNHFDIVDRREVEKQLILLEELVPEWISSKVASCGIHLIRINKISSSESIRAILEKAE